MNCKKSKQLRKMAEVYLQRNGTKYLNKAQYRAIKSPTRADDRLYVVYRGMINTAKRNYKQVNGFFREKIGMEWSQRIAEEY